VEGQAAVTRDSALVIVTLTRDRDAWQKVALDALGVLAGVNTAGLVNDEGRHLEQLRSIELALINRAMRTCENNKARTARYLGITYKMLNYKLRTLEKEKQRARIAVVA
jgi:DNA-binding NtrC family response regulator